MTDSVVLDASAVLRALLDSHPDATLWLERVRAGDVLLAWPVLVYAETANVLATLVRTRALARAHAAATLDAVVLAPAERHPLESLVPAALELATARGLTVDDACYVVLAEGLGAPLVTADRRLAARTGNAVLINA